VRTLKSDEMSQHAVATAMLGVLLCSPALAADVYTCVDAKGQRRSSDRPIAECADREQRVLGPAGTVKRVLPPLPSASAASAPQRNKTGSAPG
jgi:hypothetical protein